MASFKSSLVCQINAIATLSADEGRAVNAALRKVPFPDEHLQTLQQAIDSKVVMTITKPAKDGKPGSDKKQLLTHVFNYPTQDDWDVFLDPRKNFSTKACCLVNRLMLVGCHDPSEQTREVGTCTTDDVQLG